MKLIPSLLLAMLLVASAKAKAEGDTLRSRIYFPVGVSKIDHSFQGNGVRLEFMIRDIHARMKQSRLRKVRLSAGASLEGNSALNRRLSDERLQSLSDVFHERLSVPDSIYEYHSLGENWQGLLALVERSDMPYRDEALNILSNTPEWVTERGHVVDSRKRQLMNLRGGSVWHYMEKYFFPELRNCSVVECEFEPLASAAPEPAPKPEPKPEPEERPAPVREVAIVRDTIILRDTVERVVIVREPAERLVAPRERKPLYMGLRTNLLYDALLIPNVGAELYLGGNWALTGSWAYGWWSNDAKHNYWRYYGGELGVRRYFACRGEQKIMRGQHIGLYGQLFTYDFELGGTGYMGGKPGGTLWEKANYAFGLEYGYSLPIARRFNLDFTIGLGYWGGEYQIYDPLNDIYIWKETRQRRWIGPTKAEISLVWLLGSGFNNEKKGGKQ